MTEGKGMPREGKDGAPESFLEQALLKPDGLFSSPTDVLTYHGFSHDHKRQVLEAWAHQEIRLSDSAAEGMLPPSPNDATVTAKHGSRLPEVEAALRALEMEEIGRT
jgi:hypothetical protein